MYKVELYVRVRRVCMVDGMSTREAARVFGLHRDTVRKMLAPPPQQPETPAPDPATLTVGVGQGAAPGD